ncbi:trypsin-like cysteine/serine peptidase domain-containing protein [Myxozyma melibiosi]|uniref:Trypsin-like cysteine/serine peptidase domain-containing protein n=1 Tax=Myxozyma melibiosi TaxID=54550 RepID=A0ABR1F3K4_9ASCO
MAAVARKKKPRWKYLYAAAAIKVIYKDDENMQRQVAVSGVYVCSSEDVDDPGFVFTISSVLSCKDVATDPRCAFYAATPAAVSSTSVTWTPLAHSTSTDLPLLRTFISSHTTALANTFTFLPSSTDLTLPTLLAVFRPQTRLTPAALSPFSFAGPTPAGAKLVFRGAPFVADSPAIFLGFETRGTASFVDDASGVVLSDARYMDGIEGSAAIIDDDSGDGVQLGVVAGALRKVNGEGEMVVVYPWTAIVKDLASQLSSSRRRALQDLDLPTSLLTLKDTSALDPAPLSSSSDNAAAMAHCVVCIRLRNRNGSRRSWGSGILLTPAVIVTNHHVIPDLDQLSLASVTLPGGKNGTTLGVERAEKPFEGIDMIFLFLNKRSSSAILACNYPTAIPSLSSTTPSSTIHRNQPVTAIGYGLFPPSPTTTPTPLLSHGHITSTVPLPLLPHTPPSPALFTVSAACWNGASGGGVFASDTGALLGMITSNAKTDRGVVYPTLGFVIPVGVVLLGYRRCVMKGRGEGGISERVVRLWKMQTTHVEIFEKIKTKL